MKRVAIPAVIAVAVLTFAPAACGSGTGGAPDARAATGSPSAVAYSACMRAHGVPNFPDPNASNGGAILKADPQQLGVSSTQFETARTACVRLIPDSGTTAEQQQETQCAMTGVCAPATVQTWLSGLRTLAQCLRTHGEPNWPDPVIDSRGLPHFNYGQAGIDHHSSQVLTKVDECSRLTGFAGLPLP